EQVVIAGNDGREVVSDPFLHAEPCRHPEAGRKIDACLPDVVRIKFRLVGAAGGRWGCVDLRFSRQRRVGQRAA
ncbi:hypothetical protein ACC724_40085, partial [Rhizobium ruizarguesonis]